MLETQFGNYIFRNSFLLFAIWLFPIPRTSNWSLFFWITIIEISQKSGQSPRRGVLDPSGKRHLVGPWPRLPQAVSNSNIPQASPGIPKERDFPNINCCLGVWGTFQGYLGKFVDCGNMGIFATNFHAFGEPRDTIDTATAYNNLACCLAALDRPVEATWPELEEFQKFPYISWCCRHEEK